ncbi:MAG: hypothetical protein ACXWE7_11465 [Nitrososphaeraceae archaeon]
MNDGLLDLVIVKDSGSLKFLTGLIDIKMEDHSDNPNIIYKQAKNILISSWTEKSQ